MTRIELLRRVYDASPSAHRRQYEEWLAATEGYSAHPIDYMGNVIGAVLCRGAEIHLSAWQRPRGSMRKLVRQVLQESIDRWGYATTTVMADNPAGLEFCRRLGFEVEGTHATGHGTAHRMICRRARHE